LMDAKKYKVKLGTSFQKDSTKFLSLRYNFIPDNIDETKLGEFVASRNDVSMKLAGKKHQEEFVFKGTHTEVKDVDFFSDI